MSFTPQDAHWMAQAIKLAEKGMFSTTPNPQVGCVIVNSQSQLVGQGYHIRAGGPHAEVHALRQAGNEAKGATAYVTLEPCSHTGRTPPCADALIAAQVSRVVIASIDHNPMVKNNGIAKLREAGIQVDTGLMAEQADKLNRGFFCNMREQRPWVTLKLAASLDGKTALQNGESKWITGPLARKDVQIHRAMSCAILTGSATVLADNPRMNVRTEELNDVHKQAFLCRQQQPLRVIIDGKNQLHDELHIFEQGNPSLVFNLRNNAKISQEVAEQIQVDDLDGYVNLRTVMHVLGKRAINNLWVEAGAALSGALFDAGLVDQLIVYQAPTILGADARNLTQTKVIHDLAQSVTLHREQLSVIGDDLKQTFSVNLASKP